MTHRLLTTIGAIAAFTLATAATRAGDTNPPVGPVGSTMKTLDEVEPRIAINADNTPGAFGALYTITNPGSYYLTGNIDAPAGLSGIFIGASNVTLDLMGFTLDGTNAGPARYGINGDGSISNIAVRNGHITNWSEMCINFEETPDIRIDDVHAANGTSYGFFCSSDATITDCTARNCGVGIYCFTRTSISNCITTDCTTNGITVFDDATVTNCKANNNGQSGIDASSSDRARIEHCTASQNASWGIRTGTDAAVSTCLVSGNDSGIEVDARTIVTGCNASNHPSGYGIRLSFNGGCAAIDCVSNQNVIGIEGGGAIISNCTLDANDDAVIAQESTLTNCVATNSTNIAFTLLDDCVAIGCTSIGAVNDAGFFSMSNRVSLIECASNSNSTGYILQGADCRVERCTASSNTSTGMSIFGLRCHAEGNTANNNGTTGIAFNGSDGLLIRSTASGNSVSNYSISVPDNAHGPIVDLTAGGDASTVTNADHPLANLEY